MAVRAADDVSFIAKRLKEIQEERSAAISGKEPTVSEKSPCQEASPSLVDQDSIDQLYYNTVGPNPNGDPPQVNNQPTDPDDCVFDIFGSQP